MPATDRQRDDSRRFDRDHVASTPTCIAICHRYERNPTRSDQILILSTTPSALRSAMTSPPEYLQEYHITIQRLRRVTVGVN
jgi:hypothetical protein